MLLLVTFMLLDEAALVEQLGSEDPQARENATERLIERGADAVPALLRALESRDSEVQDRARRVLLETDLDAETLKKYPSVAEMRARHHVAGVLRAIDRYRLGHARVQHESVDQLTRHGSAAIPALVEAALDEGQLVGIRVAVIEAIGAIRDPRAIKPLTALLHSKAEFYVTDG